MKTELVVGVGRRRRVRRSGLTTTGESRGTQRRNGSSIRHSTTHPSRYVTHRRARTRVTGVERNKRRSRKERRRRLTRAKTRRNWIVAAAAAAAVVSSRGGRVTEETTQRNPISLCTYLKGSPSPAASSSSLFEICPWPFHEPYNNSSVRIAPRARLFRSMNSFPASASASTPAANVSAA